jgi:hypothetical protein
VSGISVNDLQLSNTPDTISDTLFKVNVLGIAGNDKQFLNKLFTCILQDVGILNTYPI